MAEMTAYERWEKVQLFSPVSPEATSAECGWNGALQQVKHMVDSAFINGHIDKSSWFYMKTHICELVTSSNVDV